MTVLVPLGSVTFTIVAYSLPGETGKVLSTATFTITIIASGPPVAVSIGTALAELRLSLRTPALTLGTAGKSLLDVNGYDASGALIAGVGSFANPVTVTANSVAVTLSGTKVSGPGQPVTITYGGSAAAPSAISLNASATGVAINLVVGATLAIVPSQNFALMGQYSNNGYNGAIGSFPVNAVDDAPSIFAVLSPTTNQFNFVNHVGQGFAVGPTGEFAYIASGYTSCGIAFVSPTGVALPNTTISLSAGGSGACNFPIAFDGAGELIAANYISNAPVVQVYAPGPNATFALVRTITLDSAATQVVALAVDPAGNINVLESGSGNMVKYANSATGSATPLATFSVTGTDLAFAPDGSFQVLSPANSFASPSTFQVQTYSSTGAPGRSFGYSIDGIVFFPGLAVDAAGETLVSSTFFTGYNPSHVPTSGLVYVFPSTASGAGAQPSRMLGGPLTRIGASYSAPRIAPHVAPSVATVTGDMLALAPNRGWTYTAQDQYGDPPFTITVYDDPQTTNNISTLVAYVAQGTPTTAFAGTKAGALDVAGETDGYRASGFVSVSNSASGTIPGTPLLVPNSMQRGQSWQPLANVALPGFPAVSANVVSVGTVPGMSACPGAPSQGATVQYSVATSISVVSFVPGCGITSYVNDAGTQFTLTSVASYPQIGQLAIARRAQSATVMGTLRALWQRVLIRH